MPRFLGINISLGRSRSPSPSRGSSSHHHHHQQQKKQSAGAHKRYESALWTAENSPDKTVDVSGCELDPCVPDAVVAAVSMGCKEALLLHTNSITSLPEGLGQCASLRVLDLHGNAIRSLPLALCTALTGLQVLDCADNRLELLPADIGNLTALQTLNVRGNRLETLPESVGKMISLRTLVLDENRFTGSRSLPKSLGTLRTLETLSITGNPELTLPSPSAVATGNTEAMMRELAQAAGVDYDAPTAHVLPVLDNSARSDKTSMLLAMRAREEHEVAALMERTDERRIHRTQAVEAALVEEARDARAQGTWAAMRQQEANELAQALARDEAASQTQQAGVAAVRAAQAESMAASAREREMKDDELARALLTRLQAAEPAQRAALLEEARQHDQSVWARAQALQNHREAATTALRRELAEQEALGAAAALHLDDVRALAFRQLHAFAADREREAEAMMERQDVSRAIRAETTRAEEAETDALARATEAAKASMRQQALREIVAVERQLSALQDARAARQEEDLNAQHADARDQQRELEARLAALQASLDSRHESQVGMLRAQNAADRQGYRDHWRARLDVALQHLGDAEAAMLRCDPVVSGFLKQAGLQHLEAIMAKQRVDMVVLAGLTEADLEHIGVVAIGDRRKLLMHVRALLDDLPPSYKASQEATVLEVTNCGEKKS